LWKRDIDQLVTKSPENAHYFFVATRAVADAQTELDEMKPRIEAALRATRAPDADTLRDALMGACMACTLWLRAVPGAQRLLQAGARRDPAQEPRVDRKIERETWEFYPLLLGAAALAGDSA
jgi:hypothetical protein